MKIDIWVFAESTLSAIEYLSLVMLHTGGKISSKEVRKIRCNCTTQEAMYFVPLWGLQDLAYVSLSPELHPIPSEAVSNYSHAFAIVYHRLRLLAEKLGHPCIVYVESTF